MGGIAAAAGEGIHLQTQVVSFSHLKRSGQCYGILSHFIHVGGLTYRATTIKQNRDCIIYSCTQL